MSEVLRRVLLVALVFAGCRAPPDPSVLRVGYFPSLTHAPALTGVTSGRFARALAPSRLETRVFTAGPEAVTALLSGAVDVVYVGATPALSGYLRTRGRGLRVVSGAASGGASLVGMAERLGDADRLRGRRLASPQLGNSQDLALRRHLQARGLASTEYGGDVSITPMAPSSVLLQLRRGGVDGAWLPEPWATRAVLEVGAVRLLDERDAWPGRAFPGTVVAVRAPYLAAARGTVLRFLRAHTEEVARLRREPEAGRREVGEALAQLQHRPLPDAVLREAWARVDFTTDPMPSALAVLARTGQGLALLPEGSVEGIVEVVGP
ncbi:MAG: ABC transporter substrate-binding protein [Deltaproteobacteria bacterium]|nr:ABC transporter substrate-binding protein [Deltaproteobacteria bacterium]